MYAVNCRLLYLIDQLGSGGSERQLYTLLESMDRERYVPEVVVWNFREDDLYVSQMRALGVALHPLLSATSKVAKLRAFRRLVTQIKPEVVHSLPFYTNFAAWGATLGTKTVAIGSVRSNFSWAQKDAGRLLGRLSARWPDSQIFNSFAAAESARHSPSFFTPRQLFVIRNGLDLQHFRMLPILNLERACIVGVGSLLPVKRWDRLLRAAQALKRRGFDFLVQIVGDGYLGESLQRQTQDLGITDFVKFIGHHNDIPSILANATLLAHTSDSEGCPNVVMEAMACGRVVVGTDAGDIPSLVKDGKTGFVVRRGDEATLIQRLADLISNPDLCRRMGEAGRAKAEREFGVDRLVSELLAAYRTAGWRDA